MFFLINKLVGTYRTPITLSRSLSNPEWIQSDVSAEAVHQLNPVWIRRPYNPRFIFSIFIGNIISTQIKYTYVISFKANILQ